MTCRHLDTGPSGYKDSIVELGDAFDNQTHGNESGNPKIDWHGADSFRRIARCHQQTSSRLSQTRTWTPSGHRPTNERGAWFRPGPSLGKMMIAVMYQSSYSMEMS